MMSATAAYPHINAKPLHGANELAPWWSDVMESPMFAGRNRRTLSAIDDGSAVMMSGRTRSTPTNALIAPAVCGTIVPRPSAKRPRTQM